MDGYMSGKAKTFSASQFAAALLGCTILAGTPGAVLAQDAPVAAPGTPAPAANATMSPAAPIMTR